MILSQTVIGFLQAEATRVVIERTWLDQVSSIGEVLVSLLVLVLLGVTTFALLSLRRALDELTRLVRNSSSDITSAVHDARVVVEELRGLTTRVRGAADVVGAGVRRARHMVEGRRERPPRERSEEAEGSSEGSMADLNRDERMARRRKRRRRDRPRPPRDEGPGSGPSDGGE